jgi:CheY-like chemotaxis protein
VPVLSLLSGRRLLVVEDELMILIRIEDMLADLGCETVAAATASKALTLISEQQFDAAMLDVNLGGEKTFAVADALIACGVPFLFATGYVGDDIRSRYIDRPMLRKPFRPHHLADALARLLASTPES